MINWITLLKSRKNCGTTTLSLFDNLITLQMKGSGTGSAYHNLQFNISGNNIKKTYGVIDDI